MGWTLPPWAKATAEGIEVAFARAEEGEEENDASVKAPAPKTYDLVQALPPTHK